MRPIYNKFFATFYRKGMERIINKRDRIIIPYLWRSLSEVYEPQVWSYFMNEVRAGDIAADVGAHIGLYSVSLAKRVGPAGKVFAFEPDPQNFKLLNELININKIADRIEPIKMAATSKDGSIKFSAMLGSRSHINFSQDDDGDMILSTRLDTIFANKNLDILKIDVEGYEEEVLKGCSDLLNNERRRPRVILIELHPFAWAISGATSELILCYLRGYKYTILDMNGQRVDNIKTSGWCWLLARKA